MGAALCGRDVRGRKLYGSFVMGWGEVGVVGASGGGVHVGCGAGGRCVLLSVSTPGAMVSSPRAMVWKILLSSRSDVRWASWNWARGPRKRGCCKAWVSSRAAWIAASLW